LEDRSRRRREGGSVPSRIAESALRCIRTATKRDFFQLPWRKAGLPKSSG